MTSKQWTIWFLALSTVTLAVFAGIMYVTDPLIRYSSEKDFFSYYEYSEMYSNPGIARNYEYDTVLVGTSMIQNTNVQECNELLECDMVRLPYSGGTCFNMKTILDVCFSSDNTIKAVYWELDEFQLFSDHNAPRYPLPTYLYRKDHVQDLSYLLNLDVFYHYTVNSVIGTLKGRSQDVAREGIWFGGDFSKEGMMKTYVRPESRQENTKIDIYQEKVKRNLTHNIIPLLEHNPDTHFNFFLVPFSILYWDNQVREGTFDASMYSLEYAIGQLLEYDNVSVYFYHDEWDIVTDLDNYKDFTHYGSWVNSYMTEAMAEGKDLLTKDNYMKVIDNMRQYVQNYDFDSIFSSEA